jgi:hypothetical protein
MEAIMGQPHKGARRTIQTRLPVQLATEIERIARERDWTLTDVVADLLAERLGQPLPSQYVPRSTTQRRRDLVAAQEWRIA